MSKQINFPKLFIVLLLFPFLFIQCDSSRDPLIQIQKGDHITLIGSNLCSRMMNYGSFEFRLQTIFPDSFLTIRNMCDGGNTLGFRPHSGRNSPWAFPDAEKFYKKSDLANNSHSEGHFESPDEWLTRLETDIILAFFGHNESYAGEAGLKNFKKELEAFINHTLSQKYNGKAAPKLVMISPVAFEDLSEEFDLPNGESENENLAIYAEAMREVCLNLGVPFVDLFSYSKSWDKFETPQTIDGIQLNQNGNSLIVTRILRSILGNQISSKKSHHLANVRPLVESAIAEKNWIWHNDFKIPNGVHVFGRRFEPFGPDNYPAELIKIREMTAIRDTAIWMALKGEVLDLAAADAKTTQLPPVETNYSIENEEDIKYLYGDEALSKLKVADGYKIELFASEKEFPDLANPVQLSFDNKGRLWVATMPSYPHYQPGNSKPNDKLLILEDTDNDGKADKQTIFAENLHLPIGFEFAPEGVYVSQGTNLILLTDTNNDDKADKKEILLSGFDDHDTHHAISAFCADPSGAIYMAEGVFLHTNVETSYGTVRGTNGGFYRYSPQLRKLERVSQLSIPNPWGIAFDEWGQDFFTETSGTKVHWMMPGTIKSVYGKASPKSFDLIDPKHRVRPTSGLEFVSSSHFPEEIQGDLLINNTIGFLGTKQHQMKDGETGYESQHRQDLVVGSDPNFRPVDMEFAPDGSLYLIDWHNVLIGHMQHNARDPLRDHAHGRIYRITYPSRPLVKEAKITDVTIEELLENLKLPEYRTRYRTRRELRGRDKKEVLSALKTWVNNLDENNSNYEKQLLEGLWVTWGLNQIDENLLNKSLNANDFRVKTAAVKVLRYVGHQIPNQAELLMNAAKDENNRVRLEAIVAASWLEKEQGLPILKEAEKYPLDDWMLPTYEAALAHIQGFNYNPKIAQIESHLEGADLTAFKRGKAIYNREGYCGTCHQEDGKGLEASNYPPLIDTDWVTGDKDRLIKLTLKGLMGKMAIHGKEYPGIVPMTPFEGLLNDEEIAAVLTYVRNDFGNKASVITAKKVAEIRAEIKDKKGFYLAEELMNKHTQ